ncbi:MAG: hypothetical protein Q8R28_22175, partial [Dehalococcoidia bacterium]|nr:hypothetical protein [Dehalococcoidia bacterium]
MPSIGTAPDADPVSDPRGPYEKFQDAFQMTYGKRATQTELNNAEEDAFPLNKLLKGRPHLTAQLPFERQMSLPSDLIAEMPNEAVMRLVESNPQVAGGFPTSYWKGFSNDWLAKVVVPFFQAQGNPEGDNIIQQNQIGGENAGALPPGQRPGAPPPTTAPPGGVTGPITAPPYAGPGQFAIPTATMPNLPADIASRSALEQYYANLGYGNVAAPRSAATAPPTTAFPDFATWQAQNPGKTYNDYFAARGAVTPAGGKAGTLSGIGDIETGENLTVPEGFEPGFPSGGDGTAPPNGTGGTTAPPAGGGGWSPNNPWVIPNPNAPGTSYPIDAVSARQWEKDNASSGTWSPGNPFAAQGGTPALEWERKFGALVSPPTGGAGPRPPTPEEQAQAAANLQYTNAQIAALEARVRNDEAQLAEAVKAREFNQQIAIQDRLDKSKADLQNYTLQRDQLVQRQAE